VCPTPRSDILKPRLRSLFPQSKLHPNLLTRRFQFLDFATLLIALPVAIPIVVIIAATFLPTSETYLHVRDNLLGEYISNTLQLMLLTGVFACLLGGSTAWLTVICDFPGRRVFAAALVLPLALPTYIAGYVYADLLEFSGPVQSFLRDLTGWGYGDYYFPAIRSLPGAALVMALVLYPYVYLLVRANLEAQSTTLNQAATVLGVSGWALLRKVTIPLARPAIAGGTALVLMETVAEFGLVEHFGIPTLTTGVYRTWLAMGDRDTALKIAGSLFLIVVVLITLEQITRQKGNYNLLTNSGAPKRRQLSGARRWFASVLCLMPVLLGFILPVSVLINHTLSVGDPMLGRQFSGFITNSVTLATLVAGLCVSGALVLAYANRSKNYLSAIGIRVATLGYAIPGLVLATGALLPLTYIDRWLAGQFSGVNQLLFTGTIGALLFVFVARFMTVAFNTIDGGLKQIHPSLEQAASSLGASRSRILTSIHMPLLRGSLTYAAILVFIDTLKELPATLVLRPFNFETLATRVYRLAADERIAEASTAAILIVALSLIPTIVIARRSLIRKQQ
jgi:iron(III) transport system permease protein